MSLEQVETLIVGGGQAGLAMSHRLGQHGRRHLVLERHRIAERWRTERWDALRFQFPNDQVRLPDFHFPHTDPDGFATRAQIVDFIESYAILMKVPVRCGVEVTRLRRREGAPGFRAETSNGPVEAANVVIATGPYQSPAVPVLLPDDSGIVQVTANRYRNPAALPAGAVLVVGGGASGAQLAEELLDAGRRVYLSLSRHRRGPRRYRGRDFLWWLSALGLDRTPVEQRGPDQSPFVISGAKGGHTIDFRDFAARGMVLLGRAEPAHDGVMAFAADLADSLANGDAFHDRFLTLADSHVAGHRLDMPEDRAARVRLPDPPCVTDPIRRIELREAGISTVIWATGYRYDFDWIDLPVLDPHGAPLHRRGVTDVPGLYFLGLSWLYRMTSSFLSGVGEDAAYLAEHIARRA